MTVPSEAVDAAAEVLLGGGTVADMLEVAAPHIRAQVYAELGNDHWVIFTEDGWTVEHSVECRLSGHMHECDHHKAVVRIADEFDPDMEGRWLITAIDGNGEPALVRSDLIEGSHEVRP